MAYEREHEREYQTREEFSQLSSILAKGGTRALVCFCVDVSETMTYILHGQDHKIDKHEVRSVTAFGAGGYWIMSQKVKTIPFCSRCGDGAGVMGFVKTADYLCEKCETAAMRRSVWLGA